MAPTIVICRGSVLIYDQAFQFIIKRRVILFMIILTKFPEFTIFITFFHRYYDLISCFSKDFQPLPANPPVIIDNSCLIETLVEGDTVVEE